MRAARLDRDLTQVQLAEMLQTTQATIYKYETGKQPFTLEFLSEVAAVLGRHPTFFLRARDGLSEEERDLISWLRDNPDLKPIALATFRSLKQHKVEAA